MRALLLFFLFYNIFNPLSAASQDGSSSVIYNSSLATFSNGDFAKGFVIFDAGFSYTDTGIFTFNVPIPINGPVTLGASTGEFTLEGDMFLGSKASLHFPILTSKINGGGYTIFADCNLSPTLSTLVDIPDDLTIDCRNHNFTLNSNMRFNITAGKILTIKNAFINYNGGTLLATGSGTLVLENVIINVPSGITFSLATSSTTVQIKNTVTLQGGGTFIGTESSDLTINPFSTLYIDQDTTFKYAPTDFSPTHLVFTDQTSSFHINGGTLFAVGDAGGSSGISLTKGTLLLENRVVFKNTDTTGVTENTLQSRSITLGDGISSVNDINVKILSGAYIDVKGYVYYNNVN